MVHMARRGRLMEDRDRPIDTIAVWRAVLIAVVVLNISVIAWAVRLTVRLLRAPVERSAPVEPGAGAAGTADGVAAVRSGAGSARAAVFAVTNQASLFSDGTRGDESDGEMARRFMEQDSILRRELSENAGNGNGLTPSKEEIDRLMKEGRLIF